MIVAAKLDRMFRSASDALVTAEKLKERGIHLILFDLGADPVTANGMAKCFFTMASAAASPNWNASGLASGWKPAGSKKREKKGHLGGVAPYGSQGCRREAQSRSWSRFIQTEATDPARKFSNWRRTTYTVLAAITNMFRRQGLQRNSASAKPSRKCFPDQADN